MKRPFVSIIIPFYVDIPRFYSDLKKFSKLTYHKYEILVVTDNSSLKIKQKNVKVIFTGIPRTGPAEKRDIAIKKAKGEICAFIDDDAYPHKDWLKNAIEVFNDHDVAAVGGPGITPKEDSYFEQITGMVYESFFCSGLAQYRFKKMKKRMVDDYPAYNLIIRKDVLRKVGGYGNHFYGGEDTFLCLKIVNKGYKIIYSPKVVVYHHRRPLFVPYLKQIANIGLHRGYFARVFPQTSRRLMYFLPSIITLLIPVFVILMILKSSLIYVFILLSIACIAGITLTFPKSEKISTRILACAGIILTHISYGLYFMVGFLSPRLDR